MDKPTELLPVDPSLVHIQSDVREHFDWNLSEDLSSARGLLEQVESYDIRPWERPQRAANVATVYRLSLIHISDPRDRQKSRMPSSA